MRQAYSERFYLNRAGENAPQTVRLTLRMNLLEQMPTLASRHQAMSQVTTISRQYGSTTLSYVGRANMGAAEQYVRELRTESGTPYLISLDG